MPMQKHLNSLVGGFLLLSFIFPVVAQAEVSGYQEPSTGSNYNYNYSGSSSSSSSSSSSGSSQTSQGTGDVDPNPTGSSCFSLSSTGLRYQARDANTNGEVSMLQDFLQSKGYLNSEPTGYFGLMTQAAVKKLQSASGIDPTGYVGPLTRAKISASCGGLTKGDTETTTSGSDACKPGFLFNPVTGQKCLEKGLPSGCTSSYGFSVITGQPCGQTGGTSTPTVELKVNGFKSQGYAEPQVNITEEEDTATIVWSATNASYCNTYGQIVKLTDGSMWNSRELPTSGTRKFSLRGQKDSLGNEINYATIGIQCWSKDKVSSSNSKGIVVTWAEPVTSTTEACTIDSFYASPTGITKGEPTKIYWSTSNCHSVYLNSNSTRIGSYGVSGYLTAYPITTTTFTILASPNSDGSNAISKDLQVRVQSAAPAAPTVWFSANQKEVAEIQKGQSAVLSWGSTNATQCGPEEKDGRWSPNNQTSGSQLVTPSQTTTYTIICTNANEAYLTSSSVSKTVTVKVSVPTLIPTFPKGGEILFQGTPQNITWTGDAQGCGIYLTGSALSGGQTFLGGDYYGNKTLPWIVDFQTPVAQGYRIQWNCAGGLTAKSAEFTIMKNPAFNF